MRQSLWRTPGNACGDPRVEYEMPADVNDTVRWADADLMICDLLPRTGKPTNFEKR